MATFSAYFVPVIVAGILVFALIRRVPVFNEFISGAKEGARTCADILPSLVGLITAVSMFRASGALDLLSAAFDPVTSFIGLPKEVIPLALLRPISGGGSIAMLENLIKTYGPDSFAGRVASVMCGATETTFYTITVYFGAVNIKKTRHALPSSILADCTCIVVAVLAVQLIFHIS